jgi:hypothetical protein
MVLIPWRMALGCSGLWPVDRYVGRVLMLYMSLQLVSVLSACVVYLTHFWTSLVVDRVD